MSMSSYSVAQLASMERDRIRENIIKSSSIINNADRTPSIKHGLDYSTDSSDYGETGAIIDSVNAKDDSFINSEGIVSQRLDLSVLLNDINTDAFKNKIDELMNFIKSIQNNYNNINNVNRLINWVNGIIDNESIDIEDKIKQIQRRVDGFVSTNKKNEKISNVDERKIYFELCKRLGIEEKNISREKLNSENDRLFEQLYQIEERNYIRNSINEIMIEIGLGIDSACMLNESDGYLYNMPSINTCKLFVSADGSGLMLDAVAIKNESTTSKAEIESDAGNVCKLKDIIVKKALEKGIILKTEVEIEPDYNEMSKENDVNKNSISDANNRRKKSKNEKGMTI